LAGQDAGEHEQQAEGLAAAEGLAREDDADEGA
jgi:hypothetical protein